MSGKREYATSALGKKEPGENPGQALLPITNQTNMKNYIIETGMPPICSILNVLAWIFYWIGCQDLV